MKQENEKLISGEETQPEEPMTPGGNSRIIDDPFIDQYDPDDEIVVNQDFVKNGIAAQESLGEHAAFEVNLFKGRLFATQHLFSAEGRHLPASFSIAHSGRFTATNTTIDNKQILFKGWKLNYQQFIRFADSKCVYVDGALKEHVFEKTVANQNVYVDTSTKSGAILKQVTGGYEIIDGAGTTLLFQDCRLVKITQVKGSTAVETLIEHDIYNRVIRVTDGLGDVYTITYSGNSVIIKDASNTTLVTLTGNSSNQLQTITYSDGKTCSFEYNSSIGRLMAIQDQAALERVAFDYNNDGKVTSIKRYSCRAENLTPVHSTFLSYDTANSSTTVVKNKATDIDSPAQIKQEYEFDENGAVINIYENGKQQATGTQSTSGHTSVGHSASGFRQIFFDPNNKVHMIATDTYGMRSGSSNNSAVQTQTLDIPKYFNGNMALLFNWDLSYSNHTADTTITLEGLIGEDVVFTRQHSCAGTHEWQGSHMVEITTPTGEMHVTVRATASRTSCSVSFDSLNVQPTPISSKALYVEFVPSDSNPFNPGTDITEVIKRKNENGEVTQTIEKRWRKIGMVGFETSLETISSASFSYSDYQKTMLSYQRDPSHFTLYCTDGRNVAHDINSAVIHMDFQAVPLAECQLAILTSEGSQRTFTYFTITGTQLKVHQRNWGEYSDCNYTKLDRYLRTAEEWSAGSATMLYEFDAYGNVKESYLGGTDGIRETSAYAGMGQQLSKTTSYKKLTSHVTEYSYDTNGMLSSVEMPLGQAISYGYHDRNMLNSVTATVDGATNANNISYDGAFITSLTHNGTTFTFEYDDRNNPKEVKVAGVALLNKQIEHNSDGSFSQQLTFGNGQKIKAYYDKYDRLIQINGVSDSDEEQLLVTYIYSSEEVDESITDPTDQSLQVGATSKLRATYDNTTHKRTAYTYDIFGNVSSVKCGDITTTPVIDEHNRVEKITQEWTGSDKIETAYQYAVAPNNIIETETTQLIGSSTITTSYTRDRLQRPTETTVMVGNNGYKQAIEYAPRQVRERDEFGNVTYPGGLPALPTWITRDIGTTPFISSFKEYNMSGTTATLVRTDAVEFDANGNITKYGNVTYEYDGLNRLVKETNPTIDRVKEWCYDVGGNIVSWTEHRYTTGEDLGTFTYEYDTIWKDRLKTVGGQTISYQDDVANPTTYKGATLTWKRGRLLARYNSIQMEYDADGKRCSKTIPVSGQSAVINYEYVGNNLIRETKINDSSFTKTFLYNSQGIVGFVQNGTTYTYRKNLFGDIVAIYQGTTKVAEYQYDAWGNCLVIDPATGLVTDDFELIGHQNPFRYRGYYWDNDLGLYYLMSRYYDPQTGRFINADNLKYIDPRVICGLNLYAYCCNNPITNTDPLGAEGNDWWKWAILGLAAAVSIAAVIVGSIYSGGSLMAPIAAATAKMLTTLGSALLIGSATSIATQLIESGGKEVDPDIIAQDAIVSLAIAYFSIPGGNFGQKMGEMLAPQIAQGVAQYIPKISTAAIKHIIPKFGFAIGSIVTASAIIFSFDFAFGNPTSVIEAIQEGIFGYINDCLFNFVFKLDE